MKKKKKLVIFFAVLLVMAVNVGMSKQSKKSFLLLNMTNVEATAGGEWNDPIDWLDQGFTKDEEPMIFDCSVSSESDSGASISGGGVTISLGGRIKVVKKGQRLACTCGNVNCTPIGC